MRRSSLLLGLAALAVGATACAQGPGPAPGPTVESAPAATSSATDEPGAAPATTATPSEEPQVRTLEIDVTGSSVSPPPSQVDLAVGETLRLVVTSDRDSEVHAHGFEVDAPVPAGQPTAVDLTGTAPGVYEVELHDPDLLLLQVAVR